VAESDRPRESRPDRRRRRWPRRPDAAVAGHDPDVRHPGRLRRRGVVDYPRRRWMVGLVCDPGEGRRIDRCGPGGVTTPRRRGSGGAGGRTQAHPSLGGGTVRNADELVDTPAAASWWP